MLLSSTFGFAGTRADLLARRLGRPTGRSELLQLPSSAGLNLQLALDLGGSATRFDAVLKYFLLVSKSNHNFFQQLSSLADFFALLGRSKLSACRTCFSRSAGLVGFSCLPSSA